MQNNGETGRDTKNALPGPMKTAAAPAARSDTPVLGIGEGSCNPGVSNREASPVLLLRNGEWTTVVVGRERVVG